MKFAFLLLLFSFLFSAVSPFVSPLCTTNSWSVYEAIRSQLNQGTDFVTCKVSAPSWPNNTVAEEGLSSYRLHQKYKWAGVGYHTLLTSSDTTASYQIEGISFSSSLIETDEWQQENQSNQRSIFDGIKSENGFDSFLETSDLAATTLFLPSTFADELAARLKLGSRNELIDKNVTASFVTGTLTQNYTFIVKGFYEISAHSSYYSSLFGNNFLLTSFTAFSKLTGSRLLIQFDSVYAETQYRSSFFDYLNTNIIQKGKALDFSITQNQTARQAIQESQTLLSEFQKSKKPFFIALEVALVLISYLFFLFFLLEWCFLQVPPTKWKILFYWPCISIALFYCAGLGVAKLISTYRFGNLLIPLITRQSFALSLYLVAALLVVTGLFMAVLLAAKTHYSTLSKQNSDVTEQAKENSTTVD